MNLFSKLPKEQMFYIYAIPTAFLAGYGFATSMWLTSYQNSAQLKPQSQTSRPSPSISHDGMVLDDTAFTDPNHQPESIKPRSIDSMAKLRRV